MTLAILIILFLFGGGLGRRAGYWGGPFLGAVVSLVALVLLVLIEIGRM